MTEGISKRVSELIAQVQGREFMFEMSGGASLQDAFAITSLDSVSLQMLVEEEWGLTFATGNVGRGPIDEAWDAVRCSQDIVDLVVKFK